MLQRMFDWLARRRYSIQYEVQRMTHRGGWQNYHQTSYKSPPSRPTNDEGIQILGTEEGRFRCIRRKDSYLDTTIWEYETENAEETYTTRRQQAIQRDQLAEMEYEEIHAELVDRSELTALSWRELFEAYLDCHAYMNESDGSESIETQLVQTIADQEGPKAALEEYRELASHDR